MHRCVLQVVISVMKLYPLDGVCSTCLLLRLVFTTQN